MEEINETGKNPFLKEKRGSRIIVSKKEERQEDGVTFDSKWEKRVYIFLKETFGKDSFSLQPSFELLPKFTDAEGIKRRGVFYKADFMFGPTRVSPSSKLKASHVIIDAKGMRDAVFKIKHKWFLSTYKQPLYLPAKVKDLMELKEILIKQGYKPLPVQEKPKPTRKKKQ